MAEINWRIAREKLLAKEQIYRSQGKIELANKMLRIDQSLITGNFINAKKLAKNIKISEVDRIIKNLPTASISDKRGAISGIRVKGGDIVKQFQQQYNPTPPPGNVAPPPGNLLRTTTVKSGAPKYKFNYEVGAEYLWNNLLKNKDLKKLTSKGFDSINRKKISNLINKIIETAQNDTNHPLNFNNLPDARGFVGGKKIEADYYKVLDQSSTGIKSLLNDKEYRNLFKKGGVFSVVGDKSAEFVPGWTGSKGQGIIDAKITTPDGTVKNLSLKLGDALGGTPEPSQLLRHAEKAVDRLNLNPKAAKKLKLDYSKALDPLEESHKITLDLMDEYGFKTKVELDKFLKNNPELLTKVRRIQKPLIQQVQDSVQKLYDANPKLSTEINKGITTGLGQYKETVDRVLTFGDKSTLYNPDDLQWFHRFSLGKGRVRPPTLRLDFRRVPSLLRDVAQSRVGKVIGATTTGLVKSVGKASAGLDPLQLGTGAYRTITATNPADRVLASKDTVEGALGTGAWFAPKLLNVLAPITTGSIIGGMQAGGAEKLRKVTGNQMFVTPFGTSMATTGPNPFEGIFEKNKEEKKEDNL